MWNGIFLRAVRAVLVRGGNRGVADAGRRAGLPVPGLPAQGGGGAAFTRSGILRRLASSLRGAQAGNPGLQNKSLERNRTPGPRDNRHPCRSFIATMTEVNTTDTALEAISGQSTMVMP
jgi:hypothetical protein